MVCRGLQRAGYTVFEAPNGPSALTGYQRQLLSAVSPINDASFDGASCAVALTGFFNTQNTPVNPAD